MCAKRVPALLDTNMSVFGQLPSVTTAASPRRHNSPATKNWLAAPLCDLSSAIGQPRFKIWNVVQQVPNCQRQVRGVHLPQLDSINIRLNPPIYLYEIGARLTQIGFKAAA